MFILLLLPLQQQHEHTSALGGLMCSETPNPFPTVFLYSPSFLRYAHNESSRVQEQEENPFLHQQIKCTSKKPFASPFLHELTRMLNSR